MVWDPKATRRSRAKTQQSAIDYNVFEGFEVTGLPRFTISRGEVVWQDGQITGQRGRGRFVPRSPFPAPAQALRTWKALDRGQGRCKVRAARRVGARCPRIRDEGPGTASAARQGVGMA